MDAPLSKIAGGYDASAGYKRADLPRSGSLAGWRDQGMVVGNRSEGVARAGGRIRSATWTATVAARRALARVVWRSP